MKINRKLSLFIFIGVLTVIGAVIVIFLLTGRDQETLPDEGTAELMKSETWVSNSDGNNHKVSYYTFGKTAREISETLPSDLIIEHKFIDDIPVYELHKSNLRNSSIVFLFHGQQSRKEEYLSEMVSYADAGYYCVAPDLAGHGERKMDKSIMAIEVSKLTGQDVDVLLDYYSSCSIANAESFALVGMSQGGSVAYWYAAFGKRTSKALVAGCSTPDYYCLDDTSTIVNGEPVSDGCTESEVQAFINENNPIDKSERFYQLPILAGNSVDDKIISYKGSEDLEKKLKAAGNTNAEFYYYDGEGHNVPERFVRKILPFLKKYC